MSTLLLRLAGPMQSWGTDSKFDVRRTQQEPSKSGVIGLIAAAMGIRRNEKETIKSLATLRFGVRVDREGVIMRDYHTAKSQSQKSSYVTNRYYLADAVFVAGLESSDAELLGKIAQALQTPAFPLYLGRRSCPPTGRVFMDILEKPLEEALKDNAPAKATRIILDAKHDETGGIVHDVPVSFDPTRREYAYRRVKEEFLHSNEEIDHDPMAELED